jgi:U-box domain
MLDLDRRKRARLQLLEQEDDVESTDEVARSPPRGFVCPLTMDVMFDPVLDAEGNTYERSALFKWLQHNPTSPVSRQPLHERMVVTNNALRETIHEFMGTAWVQRKTAERENEPHSTRSAGQNPSPLRSKIGCFLQNTCSELGGLDLKLNSQGCCAFRYDNITIVLDVPEQVGVFCLYTKDLIQGAVLDKGELYRRAMELNFLQGTTL